MIDIASEPAVAPQVHALTTPTPTMTGWTPFVIKKSVEEIAQVTRNEPPRARLPIILPASYDTLHLTTGVSHLATADWGAVVSGAGQLWGRDAEISGFLTAGPMGLLPRSGRVSLVDQEKKTQIEAGTLFSDLHGSGYGARYSWRLDRSQPAIAVWAHTRNSHTPTAVSYRQQFDVGHGLQVGGEVASNLSVFGLARYTKWRVDTDVYYRHRHEWAAGEAGVSGSINLWRGVTASAAVSKSDAKDNANTWQLARLRIPLPGATSVAFEQSRWIAESDRKTSAIVVQVPFRRVQFMQRIQLGHTEYLQQGMPAAFDAGQSKSAASYVPGPWGAFTFQQASQWFENDRVRQWDEMSMMVKLGRRTSLQTTTAVPDLLNEQRLRALVRHELDHHMSLEFQYGMLSAFQLTPTASPDESPTFMVTLNKTWGLRTAARGGSIQGQVIDQARHPVPEVPVKLGPYQTVTDTNGRYRFTRVPSGEFELSLDKEKLPVSYAVEDTGRKVKVTASTETESNFEVMPLNAIRGHVYIDRNRNNAFDAGEGVEAIPVRIGTWVTATDVSGAFAFYNQPPGNYVIALDLAHMPETVVPVSDADLDIELPVDRPLVGIEFKVQTKQRPVVMQTLP